MLDARSPPLRYLKRSTAFEEVHTSTISVYIVPLSFSSHSIKPVVLELGVNLVSVAVGEDRHSYGRKR